MTKNNEPEHGSLVSRSSIDSRFQWNINDIYPDQESWKTASQQFKKDVDAFSQYKGQSSGDTPFLYSIVTLTFPSGSILFPSLSVSVMS